jgi:hypothetical protein
MNTKIGFPRYEKAGPIIPHDVLLTFGLATVRGFIEGLYNETVIFNFNP